ncbi:MAG TPA: type II CAAX endopeptidase family protein [Steroidobacteraceae bacterium]|nr:type II CAAX endopeptidase family protein [Steroidobacteraceae bacterium]
MTSRPRATALIGILFLLIATFAPVGGWSEHLFGRALGPNYSREVLWWVLTFAVYAYVLFAERRPLSSIGFQRPRIMDIVLAVITGLLMVAGIVVIYSFVFPLLHLQINMHEASALKHTPFAYRLLLVTRAAVAEETLFRGYPIERLEEWSGSRFAAGAVTVAAFTYAHLASWGGAQLIIACYGGVLLTILYLWRRNLWANMIAHWIADGAGFLT